MIFRTAWIVLMLCATAARGEQISKGQRILIEHGLQLQGMVSTDDPFHLKTYQGLNYTSVNWIWNSRTGDLGAAPGSMPWARWVSGGDDLPASAQMPPRGDEAAYMPNLIALSLGDEPDLAKPEVRDKYVAWFNAVQNRPELANTILYINNYGGQVPDGPLGDFISRARPDMITFDVYPYRFQGPNDPKRVQPIGASPINWYSDLRRYRAHALAAGIPFGIYRQTYHSESEGVRDVSESEFRLQTFVALAFGAKYLIDFTYNTGANSFFDKKFGGDNHPNAFYAQAARVNLEARNLGKALVRLKPVAEQKEAKHTTSIMIIRGKHAGADAKSDLNAGPDGNSALNDVPGYSGFAIDPASPRYTDWEFGRNDPYLGGPFDDSGTKNLSTLNSGLPGDVFVAWFTPSEETGKGEIYFMLVNGLADMDATGAQTRQQIKLNFGGSKVKFPHDHLQKLDRTTGKVVKVPLKKINESVWQLDVTIDGGTGELFKFPTGAPFVGAE
jgi:hypothetical protein